jgi:3-hydroxybutyrate dehydrogenase
MSLKGKRAVVTGSTSGIGLATAKALAAQGADICLNGFGDPVEIEAIRAGLEADFGVRAIHSGADMSKPDEIAAMIDKAAADLGAVDILVNNAGVQFVSPVTDFPQAKWDWLMAINLTGPFVAMKAAIPHMRARGWGRIVSTASAHSLVASPFKSAYVASKHGLVGLTKTVALEVARDGITANTISPGYVWTPLVQNQIPDTMKARNMTREQVINDVLLAAAPNKAFVQPEQVAAFVAFICSDAASPINGANLSMDGGWTAT